jgi:hypothetical protein
MNLDKMIAVSGESQLMKLVTTKNNGLILLNPITGKTKFYSVRLHQFTPLETVGIYTPTDTIDIKEIFARMKTKLNELPPPSVKSENKVLTDYFAEIMPEYDRERVYPSDIKKVIRWFGYLNESGYLEIAGESSETSQRDDSEE